MAAPVEGTIPNRVVSDRDGTVHGRIAQERFLEYTRIAEGGT